ncbi:MAG: SigE family polymerase sigma factor [Ilumatobacteraceae bacterium]|nr:SigE family polymerase sigma factor [Ilumatobacteraceae bacterium]
MDAAGDSFEAAWLEHRRALWRVAWLIVGDPDQADDIVSAAFARSLNGWAEREILNPKAYLRRAVVNEASDSFRRAGRDRRWLVRRTGEGRGMRPVDSQVAEGTDLAAALRRLPIDQRAVIVLRFWGDLSERDAAEALSISVGTVKSRTHRALKALAADLGPGFLADQAVEATDG